MNEDFASYSLLHFVSMTDAKIQDNNYNAARRKEEGEIYDKWRNFDLAEDYFKDVPPYETVAIPAILKFYRKYFPEHAQEIPLAIDVACGSGQFAKSLADACKRVIGCDLSPQQIDVAREHNRKPSIVSFAVESAYSLSNLLPGDEKADLLTVGTASHYFNNADFYNQVRCCLKKGGVLAESIFIFQSIDGVPDSAIEEQRTFLRSVISDKESNATYQEMYSITRSGYETLNVLMDNVERQVLPFCVKWGPTEWTNYLISCRPKSNDLRNETQEFFERMWLRHVGNLDPRPCRFSVVIVFSRNMDPEKRH